LDPSGQEISDATSHSVYGRSARQVFDVDSLDSMIDGSEAERERRSWRDFE
jgi:hypothetical protein